MTIMSHIHLFGRWFCISHMFCYFTLEPSFDWLGFNLLIFLRGKSPDSGALQISPQSSKICQGLLNLQMEAKGVEIFGTKSCHANKKLLPCSLLAASSVHVFLFINSSSVKFLLGGVFLWERYRSCTSVFMKGITTNLPTNPQIPCNPSGLQVTSGHIRSYQVTLSFAVPFMQSSCPVFGIDWMYCASQRSHWSPCIATNLPRPLANDDSKPFTSAHFLVIQ